ncbi:hypothetical protein AB0F15_30720 [Amycolatopsis sp. NPDC026612]|uniref:hypothetical protein n=1 Tax=Amycolatopsis sp. NPDC026612 TaxID=3155466 RepID=UPI0033F29BA1
MNQDTGPACGPLTRRAVNMLRAVDAGRAELSLSCEPDLYVDGLPCCDQATARLLCRLGLISPGRPGAAGDLVPAAVTEEGRRTLAVLPSRIAG